MENRKLRYDGRRWEVFWTSQNAEHVATNHVADPAGHPLLHQRIAYLLTEKWYVVVPGERTQKSRFLLFDPPTNLVLEAFVTLAPDAAGSRTGRAVIHTCFVCQNPALRQLVYEKVTHPHPRRSRDGSRED